MPTVLVVEDDRSLRETLRYNLEREGLRVLLAADGQRGLELAQAEHPDTIVLDLMLPGLHGYDVCRAIRRESTVPILMLTARDDEVDKVVGLELGADDYLTKPFSMRELIARIKAMLRRVEMTAAPPPAEPRQLESDGLSVDLDRHRAFLNGHELRLKPKEYDLLVHLMRRPGHVFTRDQLLADVWGYSFAGGSRTVDVHVRWLRQKIENDPAEPRYIETVRGVGYRFRD